jgi:hypothetical protein
MRFSKGMLVVWWRHSASSKGSPWSFDLARAGSDKIGELRDS